MINVDITTGVSNLLNVYGQSTEGERAYGTEWYRVANKAAQRIAGAYGVSVEQVAGVMAALSPSNKWHQNLVDAESYVKASLDKRKKHPPPASTYPIGMAKAWAILREPEHNPETWFLTGTAHKTHAFYLCVAYPDKNVGTVVVDGHMYNVVHDIVQPLQDVGTITAKQYDTLAAMVIQASRRTDMVPQHFQATVWLAWRRLSNWQLSFEDMLLTTERM